MIEPIKDTDQIDISKRKIELILEGLDIKQFPNIVSLSYEERLPLIDKIYEMMIKFDRSEIKIITMWEDTLGKQGNYFSKAYMARMNRLILNYKLSYMKNNVDERKFPYVTSLGPEAMVKLTDEMGKDYPDTHITKKLKILEKRLASEENKLF